MKLLVFPCGSEIGLEVARAFVGIKGVELVGASSVDDHGRYVYKIITASFRGSQIRNVLTNSTS